MLHKMRVQSICCLSCPGCVFFLCVVKAAPEAPGAHCLSWSGPQPASHRGSAWMQHMARSQLPPASRSVLPAGPWAAAGHYLGRCWLSWTWTVSGRHSTMWGSVWPRALPQLCFPAQGQPECLSHEWKWLVLKGQHSRSLKTEVFP